MKNIREKNDPLLGLCSDDETEASEAIIAKDEFRRKKYRLLKIAVVMFCFGTIYAFSRFGLFSDIFTPVFTFVMIVTVVLLLFRDKKENLDDERFSIEISNGISCLEEKEKSKKIRRLIFIGIALLIFIGGIIFGILNRSEFIEIQYKEYVQAPNQSALNNELLSYKDVSKQFETFFLGNQACQSLMGGFFYEGTDCSIYPDETGKKMILRSGKMESTLCDGLASDINVKDGFVFFRKLNSRSISVFDLSSGKTEMMALENAGQFIICENHLFYIDLAKSSLMSFDMLKSETDTLVQSDVSEFVVAGNNILYLDKEHTLHEVNISNHSQTTIGKNITAFAYNGKLWLQNDAKVYCKTLDQIEINDFSLDIQCNRLLGITEKKMYVESEDGIYVCSLETNASRKIAEGIFIGASNEKILIYDSNDSSYQVIESD